MIFLQRWSSHASAQSKKTFNYPRKFATDVRHKIWFPTEIPSQIRHKQVFDGISDGLHPVSNLLVTNHYSVTIPSQISDRLSVANLHICDGNSVAN